VNISEVQEKIKQLLKEGKAKGDAGDDSEYISYEWALTMAEGIHDIEMQAECLKIMAEWYDRHSFTAVGLTYHRRAAEMFRQIEKRQN
jgi:hypothetical protein